MIPPDRSEFLRQLTARNRGLIATDDQERLARSTFLVAGCGSTGGAVVEPLVRAGAVSLLLAEPGEFELNNLNRQRGTLQSLGRNKADCLAEHMRAINPYLEIEVRGEGITAANADELAWRADLVFDAVDVTSLSGLAAKVALHESAARQRRSTVSAYDLAYRQYIRIYDYRRGLSPMAGLAERVRRASTPMDALTLLVPALAVPVDLLDEVERLQVDPGASISQLGCTADLFGALAVPLAIELLAGRSVKSSFTVDLKDAMLPLGRRLGRQWQRLRGLVRAWLRRSKGAR